MQFRAKINLYFNVFINFSKSIFFILMLNSLPFFYSIPRMLLFRLIFPQFQYYFQYIFNSVFYFYCNFNSFYLLVFFNLGFLSIFFYYSFTLSYILFIHQNIGQNKKSTSWSSGEGPLNVLFDKTIQIFEKRLFWGDISPEYLTFLFYLPWLS